MPPLVDPTALLLSLVLFLGGALLLALSADRLVETAAGAGAAAGLAPALLAPLAASVDPGTLGFGLAAVAGDLPGLAAGTAFGAAYAVLGVALPAAALVSPFEVRLPGRLLAPLVAAPAALLPFLLDGRLAAWEGGVLAALFAAGTWWLVRVESADVRVEAAGDGRASPGSGYPGRGDETSQPAGAEAVVLGGNAGPAPSGPTVAPAKRAGTALGFLAGVAGGAALAAHGAGGLLAQLGADATALGATFAALILSLDGVFLVLAPVRRGRPGAAVGHVVGRVLFFATGLPAVLALAGGAGGIELAPAAASLHGPALLAGGAVAALFLWRGRMDRARGAALLLLYAAVWILAWAEALPGA